MVASYRLLWPALSVTRSWPADVPPVSQVWDSQGPVTNQREEMDLIEFFPLDGPFTWRNRTDDKRIQEGYSGHPALGGRGPSEGMRGSMYYVSLEL
jgi:hypothetical protein